MSPFLPYQKRPTLKLARLAAPFDGSAFPWRKSLWALGWIDRQEPVSTFSPEVGDLTKAGAADRITDRKSNGLISAWVGSFLVTWSTRSAVQRFKHVANLCEIHVASSRLTDHLQVHEVDSSPNRSEHNGCHRPGQRTVGK